MDHAGLVMMADKHEQNIVVHKIEFLFHSRFTFILRGLY